MTQPFKEFRALKTPLWARLLGDWRAWKRARRARKAQYHIGTVTLWGRNSSDQPVTGFLHLYVRGDGKRSYVYERGDLNHSTDYKIWALYHVTIIPWLNGKYDNDAMTNWCSKSRQRA